MVGCFTWLSGSSYPSEKLSRERSLEESVCKYVYKPCMYIYIYVYVVILERGGSGGCWSQRFQVLVSPESKGRFHFHGGSDWHGLFDMYLCIFLSTPLCFPSHASLWESFWKKRNSQPEAVRWLDYDHKGERGQEGTGKSCAPEHSCVG